MARLWAICTCCDYSFLGRVIFVRTFVGQVILDKITTVKTVVHKTQNIDNTFRNFAMEVIAGERDFITVAREHGFSYKMDFSKVYWNSRLGEALS